ncbi:MAG: ferrous iron transport protein A [Acidobacteria bacterium]|nr:ferrous iron transport protein A [Acidobacteriota bacterium]MCL5288346.1 ferrous iron transport protein A [Acidobacteriota bacterium]
MALRQKRHTKRHAHRTPAVLSELHEGEHAVLERLELADEDNQRMMELGFIPGTLIVVGRCAPGGDPRVYRVDGSEIALRRETASRLRLRSGSNGQD